MAPRSWNLIGKGTSVKFLCIKTSWQKQWRNKNKGKKTKTKTRKPHKNSTQQTTLEFHQDKAKAQHWAQEHSKRYSIRISLDEKGLQNPLHVGAVRNERTKCTPDSTKPSTLISSTVLRKTAKYHMLRWEPPVWPTPPKPSTLCSTSACSDHSSKFRNSTPKMTDNFCLPLSLEIHETEGSGKYYAKRFPTTKFTFAVLNIFQICRLTCYLLKQFCSKYLLSNISVPILLIFMQDLFQTPLRQHSVT